MNCKIKIFQLFIEKDQGTQENRNKIRRFSMGQIKV